MPPTSWIDPDPDPDPATDSGDNPSTPQHQQQESEIKHGRFAMLGVLGWVAVDMGLRLPFTKYAGYNAVQAHDAFVKSGDMTVGLLAIGFLEVVMGAAIYEMSKGSDRAPGQFEFGAWPFLGFGRAIRVVWCLPGHRLTDPCVPTPTSTTDPLGLGKDPAKYARYQVSEIKNGYGQACFWDSWSCVYKAKSRGHLSQPSAWTHQLHSPPTSHPTPTQPPGDARVRWHCHSGCPD